MTSRIALGLLAALAVPSLAWAKPDGGGGGAGVESWDLPKVGAPSPAQAGTADGGIVETPEAPAKPALKVDKMPFSQESIRQVVSYHQEEIQQCYEKTLADKEKVVEGKLTTSFVITKEGGVKDAKVLKKGTSLRDPQLHACVVETLSAMHFPKPHDKREHPVEYPFNLKTIR